MAFRRFTKRRGVADCLRLICVPFFPGRQLPPREKWDADKAQAIRNAPALREPSKRHTFRAPLPHLREAAPRSGRPRVCSSQLLRNLRKHTLVCFSVLDVLMRVARGLTPRRTGRALVVVPEMFLSVHFLKCGVFQEMNAQEH